MSSAVQSLKQSLERNAENTEALFWLTYLYAHAGRSGRARPLASKLLELDPLTPINHGVAGLVEVMEGRFAEAGPHYQRWYEMDPDHPFTRWAYAGVLVLDHRQAEADELLGALPLSTPPTLWDALGIALRGALRGDSKAVQDVVTPTVKAAITSHEQFSWHAARFYALAGLKQHAMDSLENAMRLGFINYQFVSAADPFLENIRSEPRFLALMDQMKERWAQFTA